MKRLIILFTILGSFVCGSYVPGTPGATWSQRELADTMEKLTWIMDHPLDALRCSSGGTLYEYLYQYRYKDLDAILPTAAKMVRLGFHDCLPETNTGAGCNGCLNLKGVGNRYYKSYCVNPTSYSDLWYCRYLEGGFRPQRQDETDNNNLFWIAYVLEDVYKNSDYADVHSTQSLFDAGKSRADLWAFAALVAVRHTLNNNDMMCDNFAPTDGCSLAKNNNTFCRFDMTNPDIQPRFQTGRSDCVSNCNSWLPGFCTTEEEVHPNPHSTGVETGIFMNETFNLNVQETAAILGAHAIGRTHKVSSMFRSDPWTPQGIQQWNNLYYINGVNYITTAEPTASRSCMFVDPTKFPGTANNFVGDEEGNPISVKFKVRNERMTANGGPWNWNLFTKGCSRTKCNTLSTLHPKSCCRLLTYCDTNPSSCAELPDFECFGSNCDEHNVYLKVNMLNVDMGMVFAFERNEDGRPEGCPGLDDQDWINNIKELSGEVECALNNVSSNLGIAGRPGSGAPERTYFLEFEFYANNPVNWLVTFRKAYDKMLENRVDQADLTPADDCWLDDSC